MWTPELAYEFARIGLNVTEAQVGALESFADKLYALNEQKNLTRIPREDVWIRHYLDSVLFHDLIPVGASVLDIGCGAGFPAWPLACLRPDLLVTGLDANGKAVNFLKSLPLENLTIEEGRAESWMPERFFDVVTGRALAPLSVQMEVSAALCKIGGFIIPMRTPGDELAIESFPSQKLGLNLRRVEKRVLFRLEAPRWFPVYEKVSNTPSRYPRLWADIKRKPL